MVNCIHFLFPWRHCTSFSPPKGFGYPRISCTKPLYTRFPCGYNFGTTSSKGERCSRGSHSSQYQMGWQKPAHRHRMIQIRNGLQLRPNEQMHFYVCVWSRRPRVSIQTVGKCVVIQDKAQQIPCVLFHSGLNQMFLSSMELLLSI